jgi:hypothetical protein
MRHILLALIILGATTGIAAAQKLAGYTAMTYDKGHGTQVEYLAPDGGAYLYPLDSGIVVGAWKTEGNDVCFRYGRNTYNPVTRKAGGSWDCTPLALHSNHVVERARGDVFGLASGKLPFQLQRERTTIAKLKQAHAAAEAAMAPYKRPAKEQCAEIIANARKNREGKIQAALLYYHGMWLGERCVAVDYIKAFELLREAGDTRNYASAAQARRRRATPKPWPLSKSSSLSRGRRSCRRAPRRRR